MEKKTNRFSNYPAGYAEAQLRRLRNLRLKQQQVYDIDDMEFDRRIEAVEHDVQQQQQRIEALEHDIQQQQQRLRNFRLKLQQPDTRLAALERFNDYVERQRVGGLK